MSTQDPGSLTKVSDFMNAMKSVREQMQQKANQRLAGMGVDLSKQAYQLDKTLTRDLNQLMAIVNDPHASIEARAKVLSVIILRGANNQQSFADMTKSKLDPMLGVFTEQQQYQNAARDAIMNGPPELFGQLSRSRDQLPDGPSGRYPATEWMNTMLKEGGTMGQFEPRQQFEKWLLDLPPEQRGQAMFHLRDAEGAQEIGKVKQMTGVELSAGVAAGSVGFGLSWENPKDTHWMKVGNDMMGPVSHNLELRPYEVQAFYDGYRLADRELPDPKPAS